MVTVIASSKASSSQNSKWKSFKRFEQTRGQNVKQRIEKASRLIKEQGRTDLKTLLESHAHNVDAALRKLESDTAEMDST